MSRFQTFDEPTDPARTAPRVAALRAALARRGVDGFVATNTASDREGLTASDERLQAIAQADSVVVDPHKHGLQPYGCGCVLFSDPQVGRFYRHDSPYTYFTSDDLHLGEISLECSRAGAAAGALWLTLQAFPLTAEGLGSVLAPCRKAAEAFWAALSRSSVLTPVLEPELDIVTYYPHGDRPETIDRRTKSMFDSSMKDPADPIFLSMLKVSSRLLNPTFEETQVSVLRSALLKPEHASWVDHLVERLEETARAVASGGERVA